MPIAFVRTRFLNTLRNGGACRTLSYLGRTVIQDARLGKTFDYTDIARDLVYEGLVLPEGASFATSAELADALDEAERRRQRRSTNRKRWPQFGVHLIIALPPDPILTLDETIELVERMVQLAIGGSSLPVYVAIHDPALKQSGAQTRHAHVLIGLREIEGSNLSRRKVRHLFAAPRHAAAPNVHSAYVAEGLAWPDIARDLQNELFAEIGSDALVDPPAPFGGRHWSVKTLRHSPERRSRHDQSANRQNVEIINSDPAELIARMLRGRSIMRIDEIRRLLARFLDGADDREERLDAILTDKEIATFVNDPTKPQPRWLTTKPVHGLMRKAVAALDRAVAERRDGDPSPSPTLDVAVGASEAAIVHEIVRRLSTSANPTHRALIIGQRHSDCRALATKLRDAEPIVGTFTTLKAAPTRNRHGRIGKIGLRYGDLIIVPHAETVQDQDLAALLLRAKRYGTRLLLGYDTSRASISCSLAARLVDVLGDRVPLPAEDSAEMLRAGLLDRACRALDRAGRVRFGIVDRQARETADFVVCDDITRLAGVDREIHEARPDDAEAGTMLAVETAQGLLLLQRGQWIVYTASDYATEHIRAGRFAKIVGARAPHGLEVIHPNGVAASLDLQEFPHLRSGHAITIREARHTPKDASLLIEITTRQHAWSAALLAATRTGQAVVHVDPSVAKNLDEWIAVVTRSKPAPLLTDLTLRDDPVAELNGLMRRIYLGTSTAEQKVERPPIEEQRLEDWIELISDLAPGTSEGSRHASPDAVNVTTAISETSTHSVVPMPHRPDVLSGEQRRRLHEDLRVALSWNSDTRLALARLQSALAPTNDQRQSVAEGLMQGCSTDGPMATLVQVLLEQERAETHEFGDLELPSEMTARMPRGWGLWELWQFKMDLRTMADPHANWLMPLGPVGGVRGSSPHRDAPGHFGS